MLDGHIHIERGDYTLEWIFRFVNKALEQGLDEIWLLEHCYRFKEFIPMYDSVCEYSEYIDEWFHRKAGILQLSDYLKLINYVRANPLPIKIKFGLEICYFKEFESFIDKQLGNKEEFDFILGSVHYVDNFAFDHKSEHWNTVNIDRVFKRYFETSIELVKCGIFDGIAHPDSIKLFGHVPSFELNEFYEKLARELSIQNMYAEQSSGINRRCPNTAGLGMNRDMLKQLKRHNVNIITVSDAHCPEDVGFKIPELIRLIDEA